MTRGFGERFDLAGEAIAEIIVEALPDAAATWPNIKPYEDTGMTVSAWLATARDIIDRLNERIAPQRVEILEKVIKDHGAKFLYEFQYCLASGFK